MHEYLTMHPQLLVGEMQPELYHIKEPNFFGNSVFRTHGMSVYERFLQPQQGRTDAHVWLSSFSCRVVTSSR